MLAVEERIDIKVEQPSVLRYLGYQAGRKVPKRIVSLVDRHIEDTSMMIEPKHSFVIKDAERVEGDTAYLGDVTFQGPVVAQLMRRSRKAAIFAVTIGGSLEGAVGKLADEGRILDAAIVDAVGSAATENVANAVHDRVREIAGAQGLGTSARFSPGYCDWDIEQQEMVFRAMKGRSAGIRLTNACLMVPRKSVSGIIGMSPHGDGLENWSPCGACERRDCVGRR
jgi:hypothetical protein